MKIEKRAFMMNDFVGMNAKLVKIFDGGILINTTLTSQYISLDPDEEAWTGWVGNGFSILLLI